MGWLRQLFSRRRRYEELSEAIREHIDEMIAVLTDDGMPRDEAERTAYREFGNVTLIEERSREVWQWPWLESILTDLKYAFRQIRKAPGFSAVVIVILALGIGANTTVFSIVDAVMLRPLPYAKPNQLVEVKTSQEKHYESNNVSYPDFFDWRTQSHSFEHLLCYHDTSNTLTGIERAMRLDGEVVSWEMVPTLGVSPELGRGFLASDERSGTHVVLISHSLWKSQFGGDPAVLGRAMRLDGIQYTVIGVMPSTFRFPVNEPRNSFWTTIAVDDSPGQTHLFTANRSIHFLNVIGRLRSGVTVAQADEEMKAIARRLASQYPDTNSRHDSALVQSEISSLLGDTSNLLLVVMGAVVLVLLIACGNIANLLMARARACQREIAMRFALGAGWSTIVRQFLAESLLLALLGGAAGCLLAFLSTPRILQLMGDSVPRAADAGVNLPVLAFVLIASTLSGLVFGMIPALSAPKTNLVSTLKEGGRSDVSNRDWVRSTVIVVQVALGIVLTVGAALLITSFTKLLRMNEGFQPDHLLTFSFDVPDSAYKGSRPQFYQEYLVKVRALPGVQSAGGAHNLPMTDDLAMISFENPERPVSAGQQPNADLTVVSTDYFHTLQVPLLEGRDFTDADNMKSPQVIVVNQAFAQEYFPGENVLGKRLKPGAGNGTSGGPPWRTIVGVVGNIRHFATQQEMPAAMYLPEGQMPTSCCLRSVVRTEVPPLSLEQEVRQLIASTDPNTPVSDVHTMNELLSLQLAQPRFAMVLLGAFAGLALLLTVIGLYGVMSYSVSRRTREIGVRLALGAQRNGVMKMVLRDAATLLLIGIAIGLTASMATGSMLRTALYGVDPRDPLVLTIVCIAVLLTGLLAAYIPARRAASIDPMQALRAE